MCVGLGYVNLRDFTHLFIFYSTLVLLPKKNRNYLISHTNYVRSTMGETMAPRHAPTPFFGAGSGATLWSAGPSG